MLHLLKKKYNIVYVKLIKQTEMLPKEKMSKRKYEILYLLKIAYNQLK